MDAITKRGGRNRGQGRPPVKAGEETVTASVRLTKTQREKLKRLGGAGFVRNQIDMAEEPGYKYDWLPPTDLRCCANCMNWHKKKYIHCQCSGPWGGNIFGDKNCTFRARKVRSKANQTQ